MVQAAGFRRPVAAARGRTVLRRSRPTHSITQQQLTPIGIKQTPFGKLHTVYYLLPAVNTNYHLVLLAVYHASHAAEPESVCDVTEEGMILLVVCTKLLLLRAGHVYSIL